MVVVLRFAVVVLSVVPNSKNVSLSLKIFILPSFCSLMSGMHAGLLVHEVLFFIIAHAGVACKASCVSSAAGQGGVP